MVPSTVARTGSASRRRSNNRPSSPTSHVTHTPTHSSSRPVPHRHDHFRACARVQTPISRRSPALGGTKINGSDPPYIEPTIAYETETGRILASHHFQDEPEDPQSLEQAAAYVTDVTENGITVMSLQPDEIDPARNYKGRPRA
jgi:hypothetical protein